MTETPDETNETAELSTGCMIRVLCAVFIPYLLVCLFMVYSGFKGMDEQRYLLEGAQQIEATVLESELKWQPGPNGNTQSYRPAIRFEYSIDGIRHESDVYSPFRDTGAHEWARRAVGKYAVNDVVDAWYHPSAPERGFLDPGFQIQPYLIHTFSWLFLLFGILFPVSFFRRNPRLRIRTSVGVSLTGFVFIGFTCWHAITAAGFSSGEIVTLWAGLSVCVIPLILAVIWARNRSTDIR